LTLSKAADQGAMASGGVCVVLLLIALSSTEALKVSMAEGTWGQPDLNAVNGALNTVLSEKHLAPEKRQLAQHVSDVVKKDIAALVAGKKLTKEAKRALVADAMKEMSGLEAALSKPSISQTKNGTAMALKLASMEKELAQKKAELAKDEDQMKLLSLEKELAEKRMELENLEAQKAKENSGKAAAAEQAGKADMVAKLVAMAKSMAAAKHAGSTVQKAQPSALTGILATLQAHSKDLTAKLQQMDVANKKINKDIDAMIKKPVPTQGKADALARGQSMLKGLRKKEQRKYEKARAIKKNELSEITSAIQSIEKGDVKALQAIMAKMQKEAETMKANSGSFLH